MKSFKRFLSAIMAFCMLLGTLAMLTGITAFAEETEGGETDAPTQPVKAPDDVSDLLTLGFASKEEKLASMDFKLERYGYQLYVEPLSGEVAIKNTKTGDILMSNPYDIGAIKATDDVKYKLFSQIIINFNSVDGTISERDITSFGEAGMLGQITVKNIKNGIRVEYVIGKQETRYVYPDQIEKERFQKAILGKFTGFDPENYDSKTATKEEKLAKFYYDKLTTYYTLKDPYAEGVTESVKEGILKQYEVLADPKSGVKALYVFDTNSGYKEKNTVEWILKTYCPDYTYEERDFDHELCQYEPEIEKPVQFRVALEYYLDEDGLKVRMPANGIRYDQSTFELNKITCLPFMGAGNANNVGYTVFPDGSGTLTRFEDVKESGNNFSFFAMPYGQDYAYHSLKIAKSLMPMRMPVFGLVQTVKSVVKDAETGEYKLQSRDEGFFAIIEEGDSLAQVRAIHGDKSHPYNHIQTELDPRPKDTYTLNVTSAAGNNSFTKVSDRKYTGNFMIRYVMLSDLEYNAEHGIDNTGLFDTNYVGMANAYRYNLNKTGAIKDLITETTDIPLYIETLGAMKVQEKFLSIPIEVMKALTTFEDIKTIQKELGDAGVKNLVFKLTGFINGGLKNTIPNHIKAEKVVGGNNGLKKLQQYANENGFEIYLDTDFTYAEKDTMFDGFNRRKEAVRTVDDRFVKKKTYSPVLQAFTTTNMMVVAPSSFEDIFAKLEKDVKKLGLKGVALGCLGSDISSDFDEDEPYNREDSKAQIKETLAKIRESGYNLMLEGGNAYAVGYANHILGVPLDSSRRAQASEAIPFFGLVYHSYLNYAGSATNMAGDIRYEILKLLENGANPYFVLVYRNSEKLKEDSTLSQYFSISYENWKDDIIETYKSLNAVLGPVSNAEFINHEFIIGERVPDAEELEADRIAAEKEAADKAAKEEADRLEQERQDKLEDHLSSKNPSVEPETPTEPETPVDPETPTEPETPVDPEVPVEPEIPDISDFPEEPGYEYTKYTIDRGTIVKVTFDNGYSFILNYNNFDITVVENEETLTIAKLGYLVLKDGEVVINSAEEVAA